MLRATSTWSPGVLACRFEQVKQEREAEQALRRWADPSEIAEPIYFLANDGASFVTGG